MRRVTAIATPLRGGAGGLVRKRMRRELASVPIAHRGDRKPESGGDAASPQSLFVSEPERFLDHRPGVHLGLAMRRGGFEPPRPLGHKHLKLASLPVPPPPRGRSQCI